MQENPIFEGQFNTKVVPPFNCPLVIGDYKVDNLELKLDQFAALPVEGFRWTVSVDFYRVEMEGDDYENKYYLGCVTGQVRVLVFSTKRTNQRKI